MNKVRFGLIGFGAWGQHHARAIAECPLAELTAIADRSPANQAEARRLHPATAVVAEAEEVLARPDIEVVEVALPSHLHFQVGSAALRAGKHLFMEKPMALTVADCEALENLARQQKRLLAIGHELEDKNLQLVESVNLAHLARLQGDLLRAAVGGDEKGVISLVMYVMAIGVAFVNRWVSLGLYVSVLVMWLIPDRRIERALRQD